VALLNGSGAHESAWDELSGLPRPSTDPQLLRLQLRTAIWAGRLDDAASLLEHVKPLTPDLVDQTADLAWTLTQKGRAPSGERVYRRLIDEGHATAATRERYAWWLVESQRYGDAWSVMRTVSRADLDERGRELQVRSAFWASDYEVAAPMLDQWTKDHPTDAWAWRDLAEAARQRKDVQTELRALEGYVPLSASDPEAGSRRASLLDRAGRTDAALRAYTTVLKDAPNRLETRRAYAYLLERNGRTADAVGEYQTVWKADSSRDPSGKGTTELALVIARLLKASKRPADAVSWYDRSSVKGSVPTGKLAIEVADAEIAAGRPADAYKRMEAAARAADADADVLAFTVSTAVAAGEPGRAAAHLETLSARRPLTPQELRWQAGLYRSTGDLQKALAVYERLAAIPAEEPEALDAMGDVHFELRDMSKAKESWLRARAGRTSPSVTLKLARLTAASGDMPEAVAEYERYLEVGSPTGLRVELARAYLGAERFDRAERWAREATESDTERGIRADLVLAQALHLRGRVRESLALNNGQPKADQETPELLELFGQLAAARNEHLRAVKLFDRARAKGAEKPGDLWMWSARSAGLRADYGRATERLSQSTVGGAEPSYAPRVRTNLNAGIAPVISTPTRVFNDSNDITLVQTGVRGRVVPGRRADVFGELTYGNLTQDGNDFRRTRGVVGINQALVRPDVGLHGAIGAEHYDRGGTLAVARGGVTKYFEDNSRIGVTAYRESMWSDHDPRDVRQFNRVLDLARLGPTFHIQGASIVFDQRTAPLQQAQVEFGAEAFKDDNAHQYAYGHYQFVLQDRPGAWTAIRPNVYWEHFSQTSPLYFSPNQFVSIGSMWHQMRGRGPWRLETEVNPKVTLFDSRAGFAMHGLVDATRDVGPATIGGGGFVLYDRRSNYWAWRLAAQVGVRLGR